MYNPVSIVVLVDFSNIMLSLNNFQKKMFAQVDASSLSVFRIGFSLIMLWEVWRYWEKGWINYLYIKPIFLFKYFGFEWITPWSGDGMYYHYAVLALLAFLIGIGAFYRISSLLFAAAFSYVFLLDQALYLNHFYMVILFSLSLCVIPAHNHFSMDAKWHPRIRRETVPVWSIWLLRTQVEIVLIYAGIVKLNYDWLHLQPLTMWLEKRSELPLLGPLFTQEWAVAMAAYGVIALHLIGAPLLLWKKTRIYVFFVYFGFHSLNHFVFNIGIFPWFTLFASLIFFDPNWPKQLIHRINAWRNKTLPTLISFRNTECNTPLIPKPFYRNMLMIMLGLWIGFQLLFPLRNWLYPGKVSWTEQGHRFSWRMKLRNKMGNAFFFVTDKESGKTWPMDPQSVLSQRQYQAMSARPDMILQFAHYLRDDWAPVREIKNPQVFAEVYVSLNGRKPALLIDPERDLAMVERNLWHADWIMPLTEPFCAVDCW